MKHTIKYYMKKYNYQRLGIANREKKKYYTKEEFFNIVRQNVKNIGEFGTMKNGKVCCKVYIPATVMQDRNIKTVYETKYYGEERN